MTIMSLLFLEGNFMKLWESKQNMPTGSIEWLNTALQKIKIFASQNEQQTGRGGHNKVDHIIKLDMAKEIAMIQRTDKGKEVRQYFIQVEKDFNSPEKIMARALLMADKKIHKLETQIEADRPKVLFADAVSASKSSCLIGELAKILKQNGIDIGQNKLFQWLRSNGYIISRRGESWNQPTQKSMQLGLFELKKTNINHADGHTTVNTTTKVTGKGQQYFINKFLNQECLTG